MPRDKEYKNFQQMQGIIFLLTADFKNFTGSNQKKTSERSFYLNSEGPEKTV